MPREWRLVKLVRKEGATGVGDWQDEIGRHYFLTEFNGMKPTFQVGDVMSIQWRYHSPLRREAWMLKSAPSEAVFNRVTRKSAVCTRINEKTQIWQDEDGLTLVLNSEYNGLKDASAGMTADLVLKPCTESQTGMNWFAEVS